MSPTWKRPARWMLEWLAPPSLLVFRGPSTRREVALTFDDGPLPYLSEYLDVLDRFNARVTFFLSGEQCGPHRDGVLEIVRRGHEVASHGFSHRRFPTLSAAELDDELDRTAALLPVPQRRRALVRPPTGAISPRTMAHLARRGFITVMWSLDSDDCRTEDSRLIAARCAAAEAGDIILLHEGQPWTLAALPEMLTALKGAGHALVPVSELLRP